MVVATLAEVAQHMGAPIGGYIDVKFRNLVNWLFFCPLQYTHTLFLIVLHLNWGILIMLQTVMSLVLKELASADATNRRNAAFCVGELCKNGGDAALKYAFSCTPCLFIYFRS